MNLLRNNDERRHIQSDECEMWLTFYPRAPACLLDEGFGAIAMLNEIKLPSEEGVVFNLESESELITYIHKGGLALEGPPGHLGGATAGEFQCMIIGRIFHQRVTNRSQTDLAHFFRIHLRLPPSQTLEEFIEVQTRFTVAQRRNVLCAIASPDARKALLRIHTDANIYSSILDPGRHIVHELLPGRISWLHIVYGRIQANGVELTSGDGMGIVDEPSISITVRENTELFLVDTLSDFKKSTTENGKQTVSHQNDFKKYSF